MKLLYIGLVCRILAFSLAKPLSDDQTEPVEDASTVNGRVLYDQRQSGKYNIHIIIKDVAIIEMDQNEIVDNNDDGDYYYDEEDLTIKPLTLNLNEIIIPKMMLSIIKGIGLRILDLLQTLSKP
uniref:Uncharacterized protein n=1 Tax=Glossina morsitans morsitans TaxID=37546 RepID=A0A1B0FPB5_GLOMM